MKNLTWKLNVFFFSLVLLLHLIRLVFGFEVQFAGWNVPLWLSGLAVLVLAFLLYLNYKE